MSNARMVLSLAVGLAITAVTPALADQVHSYTQSSQTSSIAPPLVMDSWMQPTVVRSVQTVDENGNTQVRQEPLIMERHERVMVPQEERFSTTVVNRDEAPAVKTTTRSETKRFVAARSTSQRSCAPRKTAYRHVNRSLAYNSARRSDMRSSLSSTEQIDHNERVEQKATIFERRDPALDLY